MATVDILVPAYNSARFLPAALDSVEAQTFADWRIVLINDGSTDNTDAIVAPYRERLGGKLLYINQQNVGLPAARNEGIRQSSSSLIALLDADDVWLPQRLEATVASFERNPEAGISYGFVSRIDADSVIVTTLDEMKPHAEGWVAREIYTRSIDLVCPTVTFRRECIEQVGAFDERMRASEDRDLWVRIAQKYPVVRIPQVIAYYRISPGAMTADVDRMLNAQKFFLEKHRGTFGCDESAYRQGLSSIYRQRAETLGIRRQTSAALLSVLSALRIKPLSQENWHTAAAILWQAFPRNSK